MLSDINGLRVGIVQAVTFSRRLKAGGLRPASVNATLRSLFLRLFRLGPTRNQLKAPCFRAGGCRDGEIRTDETEILNRQVCRLYSH